MRDTDKNLTNQQSGTDGTTEKTKESVSRRDFVRTLGTVAAVGSATIGTASPAFAKSLIAPGCSIATTDPTNAVKAFHATLSESQLEVLSFPFEHELRHRINANWNVTEPTLNADFYSREQRELVKEILQSITTEDGFERLMKQVQDDNGGLGRYSVAIFGDPNTEQFQWEITGRHLTLRVDGNSVAKTAFGGPLVYGHGESDPEKNMYHFQTEAVNELYAALDADQATKALVERAPREANVRIQGEEGSFPGLAVGDMTDDQQTLVEATLKTLLAPFRVEDVEEAMEIVNNGGGVEQLRMAFYRQGDLNDDQEWDIWRIEGPSFVWHFRGAPHVHAYINISEIVGEQASR